MSFNCKKTTHCTAQQAQLSFVNHRMEICWICSHACPHGKQNLLPAW